MEPPGVVTVDPGEDRTSGSGPVFEPVAADEFTFEGAEERLGDRVVLRCQLHLILMVSSEPFLAIPEPIRRIVYTTNSIEAVNRQLRKIIKTRGHFPTEGAALKLLWLALRNAEKKWTYPIKEWPRALHQFAIYFPDQIPLDL